MSAFGDERVAAFVERLGERTPAPGGGAACAIAAALAAALVQMAAAFAGDAAAAKRAAELRELALPLADEDARAYGRVLAAQGEERAAALAAAADVPLRVAVAAAEAPRSAHARLGRASRRCAATRWPACCSPKPRPAAPPSSSRSTSRTPRATRGSPAPGSRPAPAGARRDALSARGPAGGARG